MKTLVDKTNDLILSQTRSGGIVSTPDIIRVLVETEQLDLQQIDFLFDTACHSRRVGVLCNEFAADLCSTFEHCASSALENHINVFRRLGALHDVTKIILRDEFIKFLEAKQRFKDDPSEGNRLLLQQAKSRGPLQHKEAEKHHYVYKDDRDFFDVIHCLMDWIDAAATRGTLDRSEFIKAFAKEINFEKNYLFNLFFADFSLSDKINQMIITNDMSKFKVAIINLLKLLQGNSNYDNCSNTQYTFERTISMIIDEYYVSADYYNREYVSRFEEEIGEWFE